MNAYFAGRDLSRLEIVRDLYDSLNEFMSKGTFIDISRLEHHLYTGTCLRHMVHRMRHTLLVTFKLLMLEKRVIILSQSTKSLAQTLISLFSLYPGYTDRLDEIQW